MADSEDQRNIIPCHICRKFISKSVALTSEGSDYIYYFCGNDCKGEWSESNKEKESKP